MATTAQRSFASGEISPALYQRVDFFKYSTGLSKCYNALIQRHGGWSNRPGTTFVGETKPEESKLVPYVLNASNAYIIEFCDEKLKFISNGSYIMKTAFNMLGYMTGESDPYLIVDDTGLSEGNIIYIVASTSAPKNMIGKYFLVGATQTSGSDFGIQIKHMDGTVGDKATLFEDYDSGSGGGTAQEVYQVESPWTKEELEDIQYVQSVNGLTVAHPNYTPRVITRTNDTSWSISEVSYTPDIEGPTYTSVTAGSSGSNKYRYIVTAVKRYTYEESLPGRKFLEDLSDGIGGNPPGGVVNDGLFTTDTTRVVDIDDLIYFDLVGNDNGIENKVYKVTDTSGTLVFEVGEIANDYADYSDTDILLAGSNSIDRAELILDSAAAPSNASPHVLVWEAVPDAIEYNIYRETEGRYGLIGIVSDTTYNDIGVEPDTSIQPSFGRNPFIAPGARPSAVTFIQQRLAFANTTNEPNKVITSRSGQVNDFTQRNPVQDDDSISFNMVGKQINEVRHMLDLGKLVILTSGGEWSAQGRSDGTITPTDINLRQHSYNGSSKLPPVIVDGSALYVQARGSVVRDLGFNFEVDGYQGNDLTIFSNHLFEGYTLVDWSYQQIPNSIVWAVRSDGALLGLTLVREQQMLAWHRHDFQNGSVKSVTTIPGSDEDVLYLVIERTINGSTVRYIEYLNTRKVSDVIDSKFMDSNLSYDGRNTNTSHTMQLDAASAGEWTYEDDLTITSSTSYFTAASVGNAIHFTDEDGQELRVVITEYTSGTVVTGRANRTVPEELQSEATSTWSYAVDELKGLFHLEGEDVAVFADGYVLSSPNNDDESTLSISDGTLTLSRPYAVIHIGLPYISDLETLDIDTVQGETLANKKKNISRVDAHFYKTRGGFVGGNDPGTTTPLDGLEEIEFRENESYSDPVELYTGKKDVNIESEWDSNGRIFIRQVDPLPMTVLAVYPSGNIPFR